MPLTVLLALVFFGIVGIALALHFLGFSRATPLVEETARDAWVRHFPDHPAEEITLADDGRAALIRHADGRGLLWQFGADTVARTLPPLKVTDHDAGLRLRFADFTAPVVLIRLTDIEKPRWKTEIEAA